MEMMSNHLLSISASTPRPGLLSASVTAVSSSSLLQSTVKMLRISDYVGEFFVNLTWAGIIWEEGV